MQSLIAMGEYNFLPIIVFSFEIFVRHDSASIDRITEVISRQRRGL